MIGSDKSNLTHGCDSDISSTPTPRQLRPGIHGSLHRLSSIGSQSRSESISIEDPSNMFEDPTRPPPARPVKSFAGPVKKSGPAKEEAAGNLSLWIGGVRRGKVELQLMGSCWCDLMSVVLAAALVELLEMII